MAMNINSTNFLNKGIDLKAVNEVSKEILAKNKANNAQENLNIDFSKFRRADQGVDLYNGKVGSEVARQIAMNNSDMQLNISKNALNSINFLNAQAATSVGKAVEGKMTIGVNENVQNLKAKEGVDETSKKIVTANADKDKDGSNPFYNGEFLKNSKEQKDRINLVA
jgi:hypothetical protein